MEAGQQQLGKLREFSTQLAERLRTAPQKKSETPRLAVRIGTTNYLVNMTCVGEIVPVPDITHVPWTQPWYRGLANVRGRLVGIVDLQQLIGGTSLGHDQTQQLLVLNESLDSNAALIISRAFGLRNLSALARVEHAHSEQPWAHQRYRDTDDTEITELDLGRLVVSEAFTSIGL